MEDVDKYLEKIDPIQRVELEKIRSLVKKQIPGATEVIAYGIPTFRINGKNFFHYAGFKNHMSIFPGPDPIESLKGELSNFKISKGTIQFTLDNLIPKTTLKKLVDLSVKRVATVKH